MFDNVYSEPYQLMIDQREWLANYEAAFDESEVAE